MQVFSRAVAGVNSTQTLPVELFLGDWGIISVALVAVRMW